MATRHSVCNGTGRKASDEAELQAAELDAWLKREWKGLVCDEWKEGGPSYCYNCMCPPEAHALKRAAVLLRQQAAELARLINVAEGRWAAKYRELRRYTVDREGAGELNDEIARWKAYGGTWEVTRMAELIEMLIEARASKDRGKAEAELARLNGAGGEVEASCACQDPVNLANGLKCLKHVTLAFIGEAERLADWLAREADREDATERFKRLREAATRLREQEAELARLMELERKVRQLEIKMKGIE